MNIMVIISSVIANYCKHIFAVICKYNIEIIEQITYLPLDDKKQLDNEKQLDDNKEQLDNNEEQLDNNKEQLDNDEEQLDNNNIINQSEIIEEINNLLITTEMFTITLLKKQFE
ncbi:hypothetical protein F8M41_000021 [Gigaspora margarita]|uniref:Uncharacterized protein n=1 Tax=Gigaspora margarita TaxID=4874 RepID=A0A8H4B6E1_GIGMA|nr:hypothetical protein F8M41_000021 [Gigaspora margarita]